MDLPRHGQRDLDGPSGARRVELHLVRLGAAVGASALAFAVETDLEYGGLVGIVGSAGSGGVGVDDWVGLLLLGVAGGGEATLALLVLGLTSVFVG